MSKAIIRVSVCVFVCVIPCLSVRTEKIKTVETKIAKLGTGIVHHESQSAKVRSSGQRELRTLSSAQPLFLINPRIELGGKKSPQLSF